MDDQEYLKKLESKLVDKNVDAALKELKTFISKKNTDFLRHANEKNQDDITKALAHDCKISYLEAMSLLVAAVEVNNEMKKSRKRKQVSDQDSDQENCGPTPKKAQSRLTVLQSQNSNISSGRYNSGNSSKGFSKANQSDVDELLRKYNIRSVCAENPNPQDERFLSIFGLNFSDLNFKPKYFTPIPKSFETKEYDLQIQQLKDMGIITDTTRFRIKNVQKPEDGKPYKLAVPSTNGIFAGKTDAVIQYGINNQSGLDEYLNVVALIEFKTCPTFYSGLPQGIFEYIGACIRSTVPVIYVQTDMRDFRFLVIVRNADGSLVLYDYLIQSSSNLNGFVILNTWLNLFHSVKENQCRDQIILDWFIDMNNAREKIKAIAFHTKQCLSLNAIQTTISKNKIIKAYKKKELVCDHNHSRTGTVYKIRIDGNAYALKVPRHGNTKIVDELKNEARIYLDFLNRVCDDAAHWPRLHYCGDLEISEDENWPFVILTSYLEGRKVNLKRGYEDVKCKKWEYVVPEDYKLCDNTLTSLNSFEIWHGDARTSNFVIVYDASRQTERAKILDFGFSQKSTQLTEKLKDDEMVKS